MAEETVQVVITPDGKVEVEVSGVAGMDCLAATQDLVRSLGGQVEEHHLTAEAYQDAEESQRGYTGT